MASRMMVSGSITPLRSRGTDGSMLLFFGGGGATPPFSLQFLSVPSSFPFPFLFPYPEIQLGRGSGSTVS